jgi:hypothetical protein
MLRCSRCSGAGPMTKIGVDKYGNDVYAPYNQYSRKIGQMHDANGNPIGGAAVGGSGVYAGVTGAGGSSTGPAVPSMRGTVGGRNTAQLDPSLYGKDFI